MTSRQLVIVFAAMVMLFSVVNGIKQKSPKQQYIYENRKYSHQNRRRKVLRRIAENTEPDYYASLQGRLKLMRRCDASIVYVDRIYLTCDSPGAYYYGSGGYRKSSRCKYGDEANMYIFFTISQDYSWSGIDVKIDAGVLDSFVNVQPRTNLCTLETITYIPTESEIANGTDTNIYCPSAGKYQMYWSFTVPKGGGDAQLQYTPDFRIKYYSTLNNTTLGCAGTGTGATVRQAELHKKEGEIALGAALTALFGVFGICLCLAYRRKKLVEMGDEDAWQRKRSSARHAAAHEGSTTLTDLDERYEVSSEPSDDYYYHDGSESQPREKYMMNGDSSLPEHQREQPTQSSIGRFSSPGRGAYEQHGSDRSQISSIPFPGETETVESSLPSIEWAPPSSTRLPTSIRRF